MSARQRWRGVGVERRGGRLVAVVRDQRTGVEHRVHHHLGKWRWWSGGPSGHGWDQPVQDKALRSCARRLIRG